MQAAIVQHNMGVVIEATSEHEEMMWGGPLLEVTSDDHFAHSKLLWSPNLPTLSTNVPLTTYNCHSTVPTSIKRGS